VPSLDVAYFVEDLVRGGDADDLGAVTSGRVSVDAVWPRLRRPLDATYYISGPPPMLRGISEDLRARNISPEAIHIDAWE
jgi:ferredoxin-NADP reductase